MYLAWPTEELEIYSILVSLPFTISLFQYPSDFKEFKYDPKMSIRGLHYDIEKGLLLKIDSINQIQLGTVYRGRQKLTEEEVLQLYKRRKIPQDYLDVSLKKKWPN